MQELHIQKLSNEFCRIFYKPGTCGLEDFPLPGTLQSFRCGYIDADQVTAQDGVVAFSKATDEIFSHAICFVFCLDSITPACQAEGHQRPGHRAADVSLMSGTASKRGSQLERDFILYTKF